MTLEDMGIPEHAVLGGAGHDPRASHLHVPRLECRVEVWFGGAHTIIGEPIGLEDLADAWLVDCAGDLPRDFAAAAARFLPRVFDDIDQVPPAYARIEALARELAPVVGRPPASAAGDASDSDAPSRVYVLCKQGFNRSALLAGRILREAGATGDEVVDAVRKARPGALSNRSFEVLLRA